MDKFRIIIMLVLGSVFWAVLYALNNPNLFLMLGGRRSFEGKDTITLQKSAVDCGPACVDMLLRDVGTKSNYTELSNQLVRHKKGSSFVDIKKYLEVNGRNVQYTTDTIDGLLAQPAKSILWVKPHHYVIYDGVSCDGEFVIRDPACGRVIVPVWAMRALYNGHRLVIN